MTHHITPLAILGLWLAFIGGWCMNIWAIFDSVGGGALTTMFVARCIGVFVAPLGALLGYF